MKSLTNPTDIRWIDRVCRDALCQRLEQIQRGYITIREQGQTRTFGDPASPLRACITVHDAEAWRTIALNGSVGSGDAYMTGDYSVDNLPALIRIFCRNKDVLDRIDSGWASLGKRLLQGWNYFHRNTEKGSRRNIAAHYDLGNEMFRLFLDPTLMYSSAIFPTKETSLEQASLFKLDRICQKLQLTPDDHLIEIGTGWGSMAIHAARHYGCRVTTTTISEQQYQLAQQRIAEAGLTDRITLLKQDYRQLEGKFDKLVSVEMIEAVGHQYLNTYFQTISKLLKPDGIALIQAITIDDWRYQQAKNSVDFIKRYIFPGGFLPSVTAIQNAMLSAGDLKTIHLEDIGTHYAETLRRWRKDFLASRDAIRKQGYDETFYRLWDFYFAYCEGGFDERVISTVQMVFAKPDNQRDVLLGQLANPANHDSATAQ
ncbi:SAM-dependent methyltransferase [Oceanobacter mangrovi]|uniref:SAM-dependent methyltransferase n=1 Tax=Oceanobacter mangrovi TaxID=2862510 RepID=UPI001C8E7BB5|nr:cyclopropane-fatty-acyl-phospholipid synthase family protein [Oceanobacter mangrovi]